MFTINKVFTFLSSFCLCGNKEYSGSFQKKLVNSSCKLVPQYILFLAKLKEKARSFLNGKAKTYPMNYLLHVW